jgi:hypothetical protein
MRHISFTDGSAESMEAAYHAALISTEFYYADARELRGTEYDTASRNPLFGPSSSGEPFSGLGASVNVYSWGLDIAYKKIADTHLFTDEMYPEFGLLYERFRGQRDLLKIFRESVSDEDILAWANMLTESVLVCQARPVCSNRLIADCLDTTLFWNRVKSHALSRAIEDPNTAPRQPFAVAWPRLGFETAEQVLEFREKYHDDLFNFVKLLKDESPIIGLDSRHMTMDELVIQSSRLSKRLQNEADSLFKAIRAKKAAHEKLTVRLVDKGLMCSTPGGLATHTKFDLPVVFLVSGAVFLAALLEERQTEEYRPGVTFLVDLSREGLRLWPRLYKESS